ncbi:MAG: hypothetical protein OXC46_08720 [Thaumarchaeota archaeon]|nr:hypothetical protein [Nitrososphaerota archaeon]
MITAGRAHDSTISQKMYEHIPLGGGHVLLDVAYFAKINCKMIARSGRKPVMYPNQTRDPNDSMPWAKC